MSIRSLASRSRVATSVPFLASVCLGALGSVRLRCLICFLQICFLAALRRNSEAWDGGAGTGIRTG